MYSILLTEATVKTPEGGEITTNAFVDKQNGNIMVCGVYFKLDFEDLIKYPSWVDMYSLDSKQQTELKSKHVAPMKMMVVNEARPSFSGSAAKASSSAAMSVPGNGVTTAPVSNAKTPRWALTIKGTPDNIMRELRDGGSQVMTRFDEMFDATMKLGYSFTSNDRGEVLNELKCRVVEAATDDRKKEISGKQDALWAKIIKAFHDPSTPDGQQVRSLLQSIGVKGVVQAYSGKLEGVPDDYDYAISTVTEILAIDPQATYVQTRTQWETIYDRVVDMNDPNVIPIMVRNSVRNGEPFTDEDLETAFPGKSAAEVIGWFNNVISKDAVLGPQLKRPLQTASEVFHFVKNRTDQSTDRSLKGLFIKINRIKDERLGKKVSVNIGQVNVYYDVRFTKPRDASNDKWANSVRRFDNNLKGDLTDYAKQQMFNNMGVEGEEETKNEKKPDVNKLVEIFKDYNHDYAQAVYYALKDYIAMQSSQQGSNDPMERYNQTPLSDSDIKRGCYNMFRDLADVEVSKMNASPALKNGKIEFITGMLLTIFHIDYKIGLQAFPQIKDETEFKNQVSDVRRSLNQIHKEIHALIVLPTNQQGQSQVQIAENKYAHKSMRLLKRYYPDKSEKELKDMYNKLNENIVDDILDAYHLNGDQKEEDWFRPEPEAVDENAKSCGYADTFRHIPADQPQAEGVVNEDEQEDPAIMEAEAIFYKIFETINRY